MWPLLFLGVMMAEPGQPCPELKGEFLNGKKASLPAAAQGRVALVAVGFTYESRHAVEDWVGAFQKEFQGNPRATFFSVPVIGGLARLGKPFIDSGMRRGTPAAEHEHVLTVWGGVDAIKRQLGFERSQQDAAYLLLLDPAGTVVWRYRGRFDATGFARLRAAAWGLAR
jgi:hypothetical protein